MSPSSNPVSPSGLRLPRRTARLRLTILYGGVCLVFGAILLTVTYLLTWGRGTLTRATPSRRQPPVRVPPASPAQQANQGQPQNGAEQITVDRRLLLARSGIALVIVSAAAVGAGWLLAGRVLRPLSTITAAARRISASSLHERLALQRARRRAQGTRRHPRRPARAAGGVVRRPAALRRQRLARAAHAADPGTRPARGHPRRPGRHRRHLAGRQPGPARLQRRAGTPHRGAAHPGQQRSRPQPARAPRPGGHHQRRPGRPPHRDQPPRPERPRQHPARHPRRRPPPRSAAGDQPDRQRRPPQHPGRGRPGRHRDQRQPTPSCR